MESLKQVLMRRDGLTEPEAQAAIEDAAMLVSEGDDPEEILRWSVAFWRMQAYLASHMGDARSAENCEAAALEAERWLDVLSIQS